MLGVQDPEAERNGPSKELMDRLRGEESGKDHFTYIVLTLRNQHVEVRDGSHKGGRGAGRMRDCLLYTSPSPRDQRGSRMPSSA